MIQICDCIDISSYSAREWPKINKSSFRKLLVNSHPKIKVKSAKIKRISSVEIKAIIVNQVILVALLVLLIIEKIFHHAFS